jgi:hypothetical protein
MIGRLLAPKLEQRGYRNMGYANVITVDTFFGSRRPGLGRELRAGFVAGQVAGLVMVAIWMALFAAFLGASPFYPVQVIASSVLGEQALGPITGSTLLVGVAVHQLGPALLWGFVFGFVVWLSRPSRGVALLMFGLLIGAVSQVVDVYLIIPALLHSVAHGLPRAFPIQEHNLWAEYVPQAASWLGHLGFGLALAVYPWRYDPLVRTFD